MGARARNLIITLAGLVLLGLAGQSLAQDPAALGKSLYDDKCADCHRGGGQGLPPTFPSLKGSPLVLGAPEPLIKVVLNGRKGLATMPAWASSLDDQQAAVIITYLRSAWGNQAPAVSPAQVAAQR